jgi:hypothetical protein
VVYLDDGETELKEGMSPRDDENQDVGVVLSVSAKEGVIQCKREGGRGGWRGGGELGSVVVRGLGRRPVGLEAMSGSHQVNP